jgi:hypothetical protein
LLQEAEEGGVLGGVCGLGSILCEDGADGEQAEDQAS